MKKRKIIYWTGLILLVTLLIQQPLISLAQTSSSSVTDESAILKKDESQNKTADIDQLLNPLNKLGPESVSPDNKKEDSTSKTDALTTVVNFQLPSNVSSESVTLSYRKIGENEWKTNFFSSGSSSITIEKNVPYQFVINYASSDTFNNSRFYAYKITGKKLISDGTNLTIEMNNYSSDEIASFYTINQGTGYANVKINDFKKLQYAIEKPVGYAKYVRTDPLRYNSNVVVYDTDGTVIPAKNSHATFGSNYIVPPNNDYRFVVEGSGISTAKGILRQAGTTSNSNIVLEATENCTTLNPAGSIFNTIVLETQTNIEFSKLISGSKIDIVEADGLTTTVNGNNILSYTFNDSTATQAFLKVKISAPGTADIELALEVHPDSTFVVTNITEAEKNASKIIVNTTGSERKIELQQMAVGTITGTVNGKAIINFPALEALAEQNSIVTDAVNRYNGKLRIINTTSQKLYFESAMPKIGDNSNFYVFRGGSATKLYDYYRKIFNPAMIAAGKTDKIIPDDEINSWNPKIVYDFENIVGKSMYDAMLELYQTDPTLIKEFGKITSLSELPDDEIFNFLIGDGKANSFPAYSGTTWGGDPNADYAYNAGENFFHIKETDPKLLSLYLRSTFTKAVSVSLDSQLYPLLSIGAGDEGLLYSSYIAQTTRNKEIMREIATKYPSIEANGSLDFQNFTAVADQNVIFAAYQGTNVLSGLSLELTISEDPPKTKGIVITKYIDQNSTEIAAKTTQTGAIGSEYKTTAPKTINGLTLDETSLPTNASGTFMEDPITVIYTYKKAISTDVTDPIKPTSPDKKVKVNTTTVKTSKLPQTGEKNTYQLSLLGITLLLTIFIIIKIKPRINKF